jgi:hypothetical protein
MNMSEGDRVVISGTSGTGPGGGYVPIPIGVITCGDEKKGGPIRPTSLEFPIIERLVFPESAWDPVLLGDVVCAALTGTDWIARLDKTLTPPTHDKKCLRQEIAFLIDAANQRDDRSDEIMLQASALDLYWANILGSANARPATWRLMQASIKVGEMVGMYFKYKFRRPRPVHIYPAIMPMLLTPAHPSYPNNHALQSLLVARMVGTVAPHLGEPLSVLADRIGFNREIAGVHFPSDRVASRILAEGLSPIMMEVKLFREMLDTASKEW